MATTSVRMPLSRDRVLAAAVTMADRDGLPAVTMRALAAKLGVEAMSLYHHLPGKDGLLDGLVDSHRSRDRRRDSGTLEGRRPGAPRFASAAWRLVQ